MTNDSHLFPPRPKWEEQGYRPDEYSRWLKGAWRPIEQLWTEIGINPANVVPADIILEDWLFDTTAGPERRTAEAQFVHGHLLKPGDVAKTQWRVRCAQPPYDSLPIPRADIPPGIILSRDGSEWIHEDAVEDVALPLYEGRMIDHYDFSQKGWVSGKGRASVWEELNWTGKVIRPQYLIALADFPTGKWCMLEKVGQMRVASSTNTRTMIATALSNFPCGDKVATLRPFMGSAAELASILSSFVCDYQVRMRCVGLQVDQHILNALAIPSPADIANSSAERSYLAIGASSQVFAGEWLRSVSKQNVRTAPYKSHWALGATRRVDSSCHIDVITAIVYGLDFDDLRFVLAECDLPRSCAYGTLYSKGFWRVDKDKDPELRHTVLTIIAFHDLQKKIEECGGDRDKGIEAFLNQNNGEGWMLPETLRLADYGLGHDDRALEHQPVASRLGPRFYDWQLAQTAEESWRECHLHARNMLGADEYQRLLDRIEAEKRGEVWVDERDNTNTAEIKTTSRPEHQIGMGI
jgi:hypothetical protein